MKRYLLDTNIVSQLVKHPHGRITARIAQVGEEAVFTSIIVACELRFGAAKKASIKLAEQLENVLSVLAVVPLDGPADRHYGKLRATLERSGQLIGPNDLLIAAQTLALDAILVTDNEREFSRVPDLVAENWLRR